jgi:type II secretory pathway pseudopilin PulG
MKAKVSTRSSAGTTLAEVTVAVAILAVMAAGIIGAFNYGFFALSMARENQRATQILLEKTETIRLYNWDQVLGGVVPHSFTNLYDPQTSGNEGVRYYGTVELVDFPFAAPYSANMRQVNVTLTWTNAMRGIVRNRSLSTLVARYGMQNYVY